MSSSEFNSLVVSVPCSTSPSSNPNSSDTNPSTSESKLESNQMLIDDGKNDHEDEGEASLLSDAVDQTSQPANVSSSSDLELPADYNSAPFSYICGNSRQASLFLFTSDGTFTSLSPHHVLEMKDLDKGDSSGVILSGRSLSNSSLSAGSNASPKPFMAVHLNETKNDKMISGFDGRVDGLSPLSVIAVSAYQDAGHPSPTSQNTMLSSSSRSHQVLKYPQDGDAMLSAVNYNENDVLQEGGFDVPSSSSFGSLDGLLGTSIGSAAAPGMRLPDLLDGEMSQGAYIEAGQDFQLSPQAFSGASESFAASESTSVGSLNDGNEASTSVSTTRDAGKIVESTSVLVVDRLKVKGSRPVKATSPSRPGTQPCPTCGKVFSNSSALTKHKLTHSDERKYVCSLCAKAFKRQDHLNGHMLTHRNKKPFECNAEGCGKSYCDARSLRRHKENHHSTPSTQTSAATTLTVPALGKQVTVIPGLAHLANFSSLQSSFPASVITSNNSQAFAEAALSNRIQYAPPPSTTTLTAHTSVISSDSANRAGGSPIVSSIIPASRSQLQFLAFQQSPSEGQPTQSVAATSSASSKPERTVLASWPSQTINTGALLLAQNLDTSHNQPNTAQVITGAFSVSSSDQGKIMNSNAQLQRSALVEETVKKAFALDTNNREQNTLERPPSAKLDYVESAVEKSILISPGSEEPVSQLSPGGLGKQAGSADESAFGSAMALGINQRQTDSENSDGGRSSVPTTPTAKEQHESLQVESPLLQQLLNHQQNAELGNRIAQSFPELSFLSSVPEQQVPQSSASSQQSNTVLPQWSQAIYAVRSSIGASRQANQDPKPVECSLCQRKFKNIPALNGHMRLHGGYFKKEHEAKKHEKKVTTSSTSSSSTSITVTTAQLHPALTTASTNVRALIEEKIIQKRNFGSKSIGTATLVVTENPSPPVRQVFQFQNDVIQNKEPSSPYVAEASPVLSPVVQETSVFTEFPIASQNSSVFDTVSVQSTNTLNHDWLKKLDLKQQFRVPRPPGEKHRRHSDSDHFIPAKRPCTTFTSNALADVLYRKVVSKRTTRTGSDPGEPLPVDLFSFSEDPPSNSSLSLDFLQKFGDSVTSSAQNSEDVSGAVLAHDDDDDDDISAVTTGEESALPILSAEDIPDAQPAMIGMKDVPDIDSGCIVKNVFFDNSNPSIPIGQPFPDISVSELEMMQLTTTVTSASSTPPLPLGPQASPSPPPPSASPLGAENVQAMSEAMDTEKVNATEDSNDDDVFLSPTSLPTSPIKAKRKHRPEPLYIPPYVNTSGFTSRLRSPRLWDPSHPDHKKLSPPPYTPPPMLSPVRSGSGLFWHIISSSGSLTPKSAPITPCFGYPRKGSCSEATAEDEDISVEAPESDILPHVNIGSFYQAKLPVFNPNFKDALFCEHKADKVWDPSTVEHLSDEEVDAYLELSCSAAVPGGGRNKEYALHLLHICRGNMKDAMMSVMCSAPELPMNHTLLSYQYSETDRWSAEEIDAYHQGLLKCDKDFFSIAKEIPTKTVKQCVQFYYLWKKVCPDEYKRIRLIRRRKEQESLYYNLRSKEEEECDGEKQEMQSSDNAQGNTSEDALDHDTTTAGSAVVNGQVNGQDSSQIYSESSKETSVSSVTNCNDSSALPSSSSVYEFPLDPVEEYPCKVCGKIFSKVKSRSAHMKSHRQPENEKKNRYDS